MAGIPLAVDVKANGALIATTAIRGFERAVAAAEARIKANQQRTELGTAAMMKMWAAYHMLTSASSVASAVMTGWGAALGFIVDTILLPFLPLLIQVEIALFRFGQWFSEQGPVVRMAILAVGGALLAAFGGPTAVAIGVILLLLGLMYAWGNSKAAAVAAAFLIMAGGVMALAVAFGILTTAAAPWIAAALIIIGIIMAIRAAWLMLKGESASWPTLDGIKSSLGIGGASGAVALPASGSSSSVTNIYDNSIGGINYSGGGSSGDGRDAAIAMRSDLGLRGRAAF